MAKKPAEIVVKKNPVKIALAKETVKKLNACYRAL